MASNYEVGRFLGRGSFASVYIARDVRTRARCAIKIVDVEACGRRRRREGEEDRRRRGEEDDHDDAGGGGRGGGGGGGGGSSSIDALLRREIDVHSSVSRHPNVVALLESFGYVNEVTGGGMRALVLELCPLGDLRDYIRRTRDDRRSSRRRRRRCGGGERRRSGDCDDDDDGGGRWRGRWRWTAEDATTTLLGSSSCYPRRGRSWAPARYGTSCAPPPDEPPRRRSGMMEERGRRRRRRRHRRRRPGGGGPMGEGGAIIPNSLS